ncbi:RING-box protein 1a-like isoform X1 [Tripterygium wilfordii]|uniref:RING-box protein 1a-like isoform X1 n=1 Tax=Tripterygium wilfordii TaxID=458696 RepID=A0A7J7DAK9_TRIWF|nr:RING-box protein 1a-like isoform X1 [Tripterygium wilfordii]
MATLDSDVPMVPAGEASGSAAPSCSSKKPKRFEIKKWSAALSAKQIRRAPLVRNAQLLGEFATMHSIFIASADGSKLAKCVRWITASGSFRSMGIRVCEQFNKV